MTYAEKIRSKTDEELAKFLSGVSLGIVPPESCLEWLMSECEGTGESGACCND
jgi:hypothetical protein